MRESRHLRREFRRIVVATDGGHLAARKERKPRRRAKRAIAVERIEPPPGGGQCIDMGGLCDPVSVRGKGARRELIGHQDEKVRTVRHKNLRGYGSFVT